MPKTEETRTKVVTMDGARFVIAALSFEEYEDWFKQKPPAEGDQELQFWERRYLDLVCLALNNALDPDAPEEKRWTHRLVDPPQAERKMIEKRIDKVCFTWLWQEILEFTQPGTKAAIEKIKAESQNGTAKLGEPLAAPALTLQPSAAA